MSATAESRATQHVLEYVMYDGQVDLRYFDSVGPPSVCTDDGGNIVRVRAAGTGAGGGFVADVATSRFIAVALATVIP